MFKKFFSRWMTDTDALEQARTIQLLRMELDERDAKLAALQEDADQVRARADAQTEEIVAVRRVAWFTRLAPPTVQLLTQAHLHNNGKTVPSGDILQVAERLIRELRAEGLEIVGEIGEDYAFEPQIHQPIGTDQIREGEMVKAKFVGAKYRGKILQKVGVVKK